ncbi:hypothetical protein ACFOGQ_03670 [Acinetobacter vivianii]
MFKQLAICCEGSMGIELRFMLLLFEDNFTFKLLLLLKPLLLLLELSPFGFKLLDLLLCLLKLSL